MTSIVPILSIIAVEINTYTIIKINLWHFTPNFFTYLNVIMAIPYPVFMPNVDKDHDLSLPGLTLSSRLEAWLRSIWFVYFLSSFISPAWPPLSTLHNCQSSAVTWHNKLQQATSLSPGGLWNSLCPPYLADSPPGVHLGPRVGSKSLPLPEPLLLLFKHNCLNEGLSPN